MDNLEHCACNLCDLDPASSSLGGFLLMNYGITEEEAKKKWCPFGRQYGPQGSTNRNSYGEGITKCLGSKCMVWKWDRASINERGQPTEGRCGY